MNPESIQPDVPSEEEIEEALDWADAAIVRGVEAVADETLKVAVTRAEAAEVQAAAMRKALLVIKEAHHECLAPTVCATFEEPCCIPCVTHKALSSPAGRSLLAEVAGLRGRVKELEEIAMQNAQARNEAQAWAEAKYSTRVARLEEALREIQKGAGPFSQDPFTHAANTIEAMKQLAGEALLGPGGGE